MTDDTGVAASTRWIVAGPTLIGIAAMVGVAVWCDRIYHRWWTANHPLADYRAGVERLKTDYRRKQGNVSEVVQILAEVFIEVARASPAAGPRSGDGASAIGSRP